MTPPVPPVCVGAHGPVPRGPQGHVEVQQQGPTGHPLGAGEAAVGGPRPQGQPQVALRRPEQQLGAQNAPEPAEILGTWRPGPGRRPGTGSEALSLSLSI